MADKAHITGLILAGGAGRRMGGADKGLLDYAGRPLLEHAIARLQPQVGTLIISANRNLERYRAYGHPVVTDAPAMAGQFCGPLAGLQAGLRACTTEWLACIPCDTPHLPENLVALLWQAAVDQQAKIAVAATSDGLQPTCLLCRRDCLPALDAWLAAGERRIGGWCRAQNAVEVLFPDTTAFANLNEPDKLSADESAHQEMPKVPA